MYRTIPGGDQIIILLLASFTGMTILLGTRRDNMVSENAQEKLARKRARGKIEFIRHLIVYLAVMALLAIINNVTFRGYQWWLWPALFWGIGVIINFLIAFVFKGGGLKKLEQELYRKEMEKLKANEKKS
jgi:protein-S-isoprenylcysteine O-methyltransferase Ste14